MYKVLITSLIIFLSTHTGYAQEKGTPTIDSFTLKNGTVLHIGDTLTLGKVSGKSDRYQYIDLPPRGPFLILPRFRPHKNYEGEAFVIQKFKEVYVSKSKTRTIAVIYSKPIGTYYLNIHPAFESAEIAAVKKGIKEADEEEAEEEE